MKPFSKSNNSSSEMFDAISMEFLETFVGEDCLYPWNPMDAEVEAYFEHIEQQFSLIETIALDELETKVSDLFNQMKSSFD